MNSPQPAWVRAFIAINLPAEVKEVLRAVQSDLREAIHGNAIRWTPPEQVHLTLRFLGNVAADSVPGLESGLRQACEGIAPFELKAGGVGAFPCTARPRVLWLGLGGDLEQLRLLEGRISRQTAAWGESDEREFHPHLTLARAKETRPPQLREISRALAAQKPARLVRWRVAEVDLMRSELSPAGAQHSRLAAVPLAPVAGKPQIQR